MKNKNQDTESIFIAKSKYLLLRKILQNVHDNLGKVIQILEAEPEAMDDLDDKMAGISQSINEITRDLEVAGSERVMEGVFDGEKMISQDGQEYTIPANYASKSKLVEGDILKLTINKRGDFLYKQIGPVERKKIIGTLGIDKNGDYFVSADKKKWKVISASVTYFKGQPGDEAVILVPKDAASKWSAIENIVKK
ncbi:MAG: hypothetical protein A2Y67_01840 [Candidatus Buchananbacteria bacterium RBG_13_39_9]|uniref:50S ribosomal protein L7/L12 n=1 Tax=Candidatus Buchananbacteria bacterium RBG_13_39_9 TaxID=1797531 RepID=A0A1G1XQN0_9BACT|nr:MAG: hypothetical protein A2Y67_01840 [Candidatus Buchananbacteria bacterium RBG_13_39_9]